MKSRIKRVWEGQSIARIYMDDSFRLETIRGRVVDVGGGRSPDYFNYLKHEGVKSIEVVDYSVNKVDFEKDKLPYKDSSVDTAICANVFEHIYNHGFLAREIARILMPGAKLIGFVPFLLNYHPDPHDYFRYTKEALRRIFLDSGFSEVEVSEVGGGPFLVNFNNIVLSMPRVARAALFPLYRALDSLFLRFRPNARERYPVGYKFVAKK